jgi:hypothetical protein
MPRAPPLWGGAARTERTHAAARARREGLCVTRTRPHALCVPHPFAFLFDPHPFAFLFERPRVA